MAIKITENGNVIYENEPNVNRVLFPNVKEGLSPEEITQAVDKWLEDHPEATTTVVDGSITLAKLDSNLQTELSSMDSDIDELKENLSDVFDGLFSVENIGLNSSKASRGISDTGLGAWDESKTAYFYPVTPGELIYLKLNANTGTTTAVWEFNTVGEMGSMTASTLVGDVHFDAIDGNVRVPSGAAYVVVAQDTTVTDFVVGSVEPISYQSQIDDVKYGAYEPISGSFEIGSILNGANSTTKTRVRHISPVSYNRDIFLFVKSGYKYYVAFYSDATGSTYLYSREFVTNDLPIIISANSYFRLVICKTTEEAVTDIDTYVKSLYVTTQLFNNPQIYRNPLVRQVAHQGLSGKPNASTGYCLRESYIYAAIAGFTHGECDIVFTSDGIPVCCHDATFTDATSGDTVTIANETYANLILHNYHGSTIASFDEIVKICKTYGMGVYVDHLDASWASAQWQALFDVIQKYDMAKNTIWLISAVSSLTSGVIKAWYADANFSRMFTSVPSDFTSTVTTMKGLKTASNMVSIDLPTASIAAEDMPTYTAQLVPEVSLEVWCADTIEDWFAYLPYVSGITSNRICANIARRLA